MTPVPSQFALAERPATISQLATATLLELATATPDAGDGHARYGLLLSLYRHPDHDDQPAPR
jgi:hypothetical protein